MPSAAIGIVKKARPARSWYACERVLYRYCPYSTRIKGKRMKMGGMILQFEDWIHFPKPESNWGRSRSTESESIFLGRNRRHYKIVDLAALVNGAPVSRTLGWFQRDTHQSPAVGSSGIQKWKAAGR